MPQNILYYLKSKILFILSSSIMLAAISFGASFLFADLYKTDVYCYSNVFDNVQNKSVFKSFNLLIGTGNNEEIKRLTNLNDEIINEIKKVDFFEIVSRQNNYFKISLISKSNTITQEFLKGIIYFYENAGINKEIIELEYKKVQNKVHNKTLAVEKIDSIYNLMKKNDNIILESDIELTRNIILDELEDEKMKLITDKGLNIVNTPYSPNFPYFPNKLIFLVFGFIIGFIISLIFYVLSFELKRTENE